jgi:hypothetical protein
VVVNLSRKWFPHPLFSPIKTTSPRKGTEKMSPNNMNLYTKVERKNRKIKGIDKRELSKEN